MAFFHITLHRSAIGLPQRTRDVLAALGLRRRSQAVVHAVTPSTAGLIFKVKELVRVRELEASSPEGVAAAAATTGAVGSAGPGVAGPKLRGRLRARQVDKAAAAALGLAGASPRVPDPGYSVVRRHGAAFEKTSTAEGRP